MNENMSQLVTPSNFQFSAASLDSLGATEYTLATIIVDVSGSVNGWERELEKCIKEIAKSCKKSPRCDNLMLRVVKFNDGITEVHGFKELVSIKDSDYDNTLKPYGSTALYQAVQSSVEASRTYGKTLSGQDFSANAVVYVITDGEDNCGGATPTSNKKAIEAVQKEEALESLAVILIGVGNDANNSVYLDEYKNKAGITQFIDLTGLFNKSSPAGALAKLAGFVSKSISSTSQALASGNSVPQNSNLVI